MLRLSAAVHVTACLALSPAMATAMIGQTFGNGLAGLDICAAKDAAGTRDTVILNYTLSSAAEHGVLHHFWITGDHGPGMIDEAWISCALLRKLQPPAGPAPTSVLLTAAGSVSDFVDGESTPSISFQPAQMCGQFFPELMASNETDLYSAGPLCGRNSNVVRQNPWAERSAQLPCQSRLSAETPCWLTGRLVQHVPGALRALGHRHRPPCGLLGHCSRLPPLLHQRPRHRGPAHHAATLRDSA